MRRIHHHLTQYFFQACVSLMLLVLVLPAHVNAQDDTEYKLDYTVQFLPAEQVAAVNMEVRPDTRLRRSHHYGLDCFKR
jgi:hypothetical protein